MITAMLSATKPVAASRLQRLLGPAQVLLNPIISLVVLLLTSLLLIPLASQPLSVPLAAVSTYLLLMAVRLEQPWLSLTPLPPLTILCLGAWVRCGLGGLLLAFGSPLPLEASNSAFWRHLPEAQLLWLAVSGAAVVIFTCKPARLATSAIPSQDARPQPLVGLTIACGLFAITSISIGVFAGTLDRNPESYLYWVSQRWRPDALFTMLARFRDAFFLLAPLALVKAKRQWQRATILTMAILYPVMALPLGGRGLVLYPLVYAAFGLWLTAISAKTLRILIAITLMGCLVAIPSIESYRGTSGFTSPKEDSLGSRFTLLTNAIQTTATQVELPTLLNRTGASLYGCSDGYLFQEPALSRPRAGLHRMGAILTAWLPELLAPKAVPVRDAHIIAEEVRGRSRQEAETMPYTSFACISLGGDLYWRGGWPAVGLGATAFAIFYRLASGLWYQLARWASAWQILIIAYPATFLTMYPAGSIGETAWLWMWDLPKYIIFLGLIYLTTRWLNRSHPQNS
jgi:hypothetical protein